MAHLLILYPAAAVASITVNAMVPLEDWRFWCLMAIAQVFILVGWFASSGDKLAGWLDSAAPTWFERLSALKTVAASVFVGNASFIGVLLLQHAEVYSLIAAGASSWGADRILAKWASRIGDDRRVF